MKELRPSFTEIQPLAEKLHLVTYWYYTPEYGAHHRIKIDWGNNTADEIDTYGSPKIILSMIV